MFNSRITIFLLIFLLKGVNFAILHVEFKNNWPLKDRTPPLFNHNGDTPSYIIPVQNLILGNGYATFNPKTRRIESSTHRLPGFVLTYGPLYFLFGEQIGLNLLVVGQFIISCIAVYLLGRISFLLLKNKIIEIITVITMSISAYTNVWDQYGLAETFGCSFFIISIYFLLQYLCSSARLTFCILLSGLFLLLAFLFKVVIVVFFPVFLIIYGYHCFFVIRPRMSKIEVVKLSMLFVFPLIIFEAVWVTRNFNLRNELYFLEGHSMSYDDKYDLSLVKIREFTKAIGGDYQEWAKDGQLNWFLERHDGQKIFNANDYCSNYNYDTLVKLRNEYHELDSIVDQKQKRSKEVLFSKKMDANIESYKAEKPIYYYFLNKLELTWRFLFPKRLDNLPLPSFIKMNFFEKSYKAMNYFFVIFVVATSLLGISLAMIKGQSINLKLFTLFPMIYVFIMGSYLGYVECRFLYLIFPLMLIYTIYFFHSIFEQFSRTRKVVIAKIK